MPPCLVPIQNGFGEVVQDESHGLGQYYDDAGYVQPILKFRKSEVEALGTFDYARTAERVGGMPQHYRHQYIVSQRFRKFLEAKKAHTFDFVPVELVD